MNIYISNIDTQWQKEDLKSLFAKYGEVESTEIAIDAFTEQSRGFGYVEMPNEEQAQAAIAALDKTDVGGRTITVHEAEVKQERRGSYKVGDGAVNAYRFKRSK